MLAQAQADETVTEAQAIAGEIRGDAEASAQQLVADAEQLAAHLVETERIRAHAIREEALVCRAVVQGDIAALEDFASQARARLRDALETELNALDALLAAVTNRPALHEIDLTDPTLAGEPGLAPAESDCDTAPRGTSWAAPESVASSTDRPVIALMVRERESER